MKVKSPFITIAYYKGDAENARPENDGRKLRGLENAGLENDRQTFSKLWAQLRGLENVGVQV